MPAENGGRRDNASREDVRFSTKLGFAPSDRATYAVGYIKQQGEKDNPPYAGPPGEFRIRYWQWPQWDKESVYLLADQRVGKAFHLRGRLYYDQFASALFSYDDATFSNQTKPFAFQTFNDDDSYGGNFLLSSTALAGHTLGVAMHLKRDEHRERDQNEVVGRYEDVTWSTSVEDEFAIGAKNHVVAGLMYSRRRGNRAERFDLEEIFPLIEKGSLEAQIAVQHSVSDAGHLFASLGRRTRFPTIKDRYSYRDGRALPNPSLEPERALNLGIGYDGVLLPVIQIRTELFYSRINDVIQTGEVTDPASGRLLAQLQNAGRARHVGGEVTLRFQANSWLRGESSYAYIHLKNLEDASLRFTHTPSHSFRVHLEATNNSKLALRGWITHNSSRFTRIEGTSLTELNGYINVDLEGAYQFQPGTKFRVGVRNVLDVNYEIVAGYPEPGRSLFAKMTYTFVR
jgi:iron complex outermembrane receptor protein